MGCFLFKLTPNNKWANVLKMSTEKKKLPRKPSMLLRFASVDLKGKAMAKAHERGLTLTGYINTLLRDDLLGRRRK